MKTIKLTRSSWKQIKAELQQIYPAKTFMLAQNMKTILGFTVRWHYANEHEVHLDFYNDAKKTLFLLQFSSLIENPSKYSDID